MTIEIRDPRFLDIVDDGLELETLADGFRFTEGPIWHPALTLLRSDFEQPNGLAFTVDDHELYVADSPRMHIRKFQVADDGSLSGGEVFAESTGEGTGAPDGLKVASTGHVFCAGPGGVHVYDPDDGICLGVIRTPAFCANFTWGGDDFLTFFMTSSQHLYRTRVKVAGIPLF